MTRSRRSVLRSGAGALAVGALAGCLGEPDLGDGSDGGYAAFFALQDWTQQIVGDDTTVRNPVDTGEMGHGWEPPANIQQEIADSEFFVYLDINEFQWAQNIVADIEGDTEGLTVIDGMGDLSVGEELSPVDNHVWVDPVLAQSIVGTIADGLGEMDPDNAALYSDNAAAYSDRLDDVDQAFQQLMADAERDEAILAGHDSFGYIEDRYAFELHTPVGTSPDEVARESDIAELIDIAARNEIETVLYDPFETPGSDEPPRMVEVLMDSDETVVTSAEPLTPAEGTTDAWNEQGWGWVEQMTEINIPSLRTALDAA